MVQDVADHGELADLDRLVPRCVAGRQPDHHAGGDLLVAVDHVQQLLDRVEEAVAHQLGALDDVAGVGEHRRAVQERSAGVVAVQVRDDHRADVRGGHPCGGQLALEPAGGRGPGGGGPDARVDERDMALAVPDQEAVEVQDPFALVHLRAEEGLEERQSERGAHRADGVTQRGDLDVGYFSWLMRHPSTLAAARTRSPHRPRRPRACSERSGT
ncbi:hypothetical protein GCM10020219_015800 [Nonomuraea dietziae]